MSPTREIRIDIMMIALAIIAAYDIVGCLVLDFGNRGSVAGGFGVLWAMWLRSKGRSLWPAVGGAIVLILLTAAAPLTNQTAFRFALIIGSILFYSGFSLWLGLRRPAIDPTVFSDKEDRP